MNTTNPFQKILDKYRKISFSQRDKGDRFERLMQAYLLTDPYYTNHLKTSGFKMNSMANKIWAVTTPALI